MVFYFYFIYIYWPPFILYNTLLGLVVESN